MNRSEGRNVHFYHGATAELLGGLYQNGSVTEELFLTMLTDTLLIAPEAIEVKSRSQQVISATSNPLQPGEYDIFSSGMCCSGSHYLLIYFLYGLSPLSLHA